MHPVAQTPSPFTATSAIVLLHCRGGSIPDPAFWLTSRPARADAKCPFFGPAPDRAAFQKATIGLALTKVVHPGRQRPTLAAVVDANLPRDTRRGFSNVLQFFHA